MGDTAVLVSVTAVALLFAAGMALLIGHRNAHWRRRSIVLASALPLPAITLVFCIFVYVDAALTPPEKCGLDGCAMAQAGSIMLALSAMALMLLGCFAVLIVLRTRRR
jgi:Zn-dependent protease with chaperone function